MILVIIENSISKIKEKAHENNNVMNGTKNDEAELIAIKNAT
jgi:hypothetical protein